MKICQNTKNITLPFTSHVTTSRALLDVNILTIIYKLFIYFYITKI